MRSYKTVQSSALLLYYHTGMVDYGTEEWGGRKVLWKRHYFHAADDSLHRKQHICLYYVVRILFTSDETDVKWGENRNSSESVASTFFHNCTVSTGGW